MAEHGARWPGRRTGASGAVLASTRFASYLLLQETADPTVVAVVAFDAVRLPVAACVPRLPALAVAAPAQVGGGVITADGHTWRPVRWWDPTPRLDARALRTHGWRLTDVIASEPPTAYGVEVDVAQAVVAALVEGDASPACGILGSGPGLTPAGDDVVAGALAALALMDRLPVHVADAVTSAARSRTTALSASLLTAAARGQVVPEAARTVRALARGGDVHEVTEIARRLFAVGATSGHDLALGLATALTSAVRVTAREAT
jgi:hypothetical protein